VAALMAAPRAKPRRSKGTGSIYKRPDGRWVGVADFGWRGGKRWRPKVVAATQRQAQQRLAALIADHQAGKPAPASGRELTGAFLTRWLETVQRLHLAPSTYVSQEMIVRCHLRPAFGHRPLAQLTPAEIQDYVAAKARTLAPGTVRLHVSVLRHALNVAVEWGLVARNPAARVRLPKRPERATLVLGWAEAARFLRVVAADRLAALYVVGLATGMRVGELLGLQWAAVDLDAGVLRVERKLLRLRGQLVEDPPKTARGRRVIELVPWAADALRAHQARQAAELEQAGVWARPDLVFTSPLGEPLWDRAVSSRWLPALLARAGLPRMTMHQLRHSLASLLLSDGADVAAVSALLGHSDPSITYRIYRHLLPHERGRAVSRLERLSGDAPE
jgi:integrase